MNKLFLLIAGDCYYPSSGTGDWRRTFSSREEIEAMIEIEEIPIYFKQGPRKGQIKETYKKYKLNGENIDWYEIVDLREWIN